MPCSLIVKGVGSITSLITTVSYYIVNAEHNGAKREQTQPVLCGVADPECPHLWNTILEEHSFMT